MVPALTLSIQGPLKFLLQLVGAHTEAVSGLIGVYEGLGETLSLIQQSWYLHQRDAHLETCLVGVYKDILEFHRRAMEYFKKPGKFPPKPLLNSFSNNEQHGRGSSMLRGKHTSQSSPT